MARVYAVLDDDGYVLDEVAIFEEEGEETSPIPSNYVRPNYEKRLFVPKWDFDKEEWIEGLTPEEVAAREEEIRLIYDAPSEMEVMQNKVQTLSDENADLVLMLVMSGVI